MCRWSILLLMLMASATAARAQEPLVLPRLSGPIRLDGLSNEPAWQRIDPLPLVMYQPTYRGGMSERTEIRVSYDDNYLYVAGRLYDSHPEGIRANSLYRDRYSGDDTFAIILDTFNDNENALWFFTTPAGIRVDMAVSNDAAAGGPFGGSVNRSWDTFWRAAAVQNEEGWFAEIRIPLSSLGFQAEGGRVVMGMSTYRYIARKNERHLFPAIPPNWQRGFAKPSQMRDVVLKGVDASQPVYVQPYLLSGLERVAEQGTVETAYRSERDFNTEVGLDLKYNLASNFTLDVTINTDFAQVEADAERINLTRFPLFFPEKRAFFQERASLFSFRTGGRNRLYFSRRIGLVEGKPVRILGGVRLVGRLGNWDIGLLDIQTAEDDVLGVPSENFGVMRLKRRVFNANSYVGGIVTSRVGLDGSYNIAYGLDGLFRVVGDEYLTLKWAQTFDHALLQSGRFDAWSAGLLHVTWERRRQRSWSYQASLTRSGADYRPDMGFITRRNFTEMRGRLSYGWFPGERATYRSVTPSVGASMALRNEDGTVESAQAEHEWSLQLKSGASLAVELGGRFEDLRMPLVLPERTGVPPGRYTFYGARGSYGAPVGALFRPEIAVEVGTFFDGWRLGVEASSSWYALPPYLEVEGRYAVDVVHFPDRDQRFVAHVAGLRTLMALNKRISASAFLQYNSAGSVVLSNLRLRYNFGEGRDFWLVYNESFNVGRSRTTFLFPRAEVRTVLLKFTYTFGL